MRPHRRVSVWLENRRCTASGGYVGLDLSNVVAVSAGYVQGMALNSDGQVVTWSYSNAPAGVQNVLAIANGDIALIGNGPPAFRVNMTNPVWNAGFFGVYLPGQRSWIHRLEFKNSLQDLSWTALPLVAGNGVMLTLTDSTATSAQRFYRVRQW